MAADSDFGYFSDSTEDKAVEDLISQAKELSVLEQVSAINCSGFTDSVLPTDVEQRFRKLKSFPVAKPKTSIDTGNDDTRNQKSLQHSKSELSERTPDGKMGLETNSVQHSREFLSENKIFLDSKQSPDGKMGLKENSKRGSVSVSKSTSVSSPLSSSNSSMNSPSPPRNTGCFWCSPKRTSKKKSKENRIAGSGVDWGKTLDLGKTDDFLSDLSTFSVKEQQKILKKAIKEEEKVNREAEKIVKWAKQASMRLNAHDTEDELSDD